MNIISVTIFVSILAIILVTMGYTLQNKSKNLLYLIIAGGVTFIILGISVFADPIQQQTGTNTTYNDTHVNTEIQYEPINNSINLILAWIFTLTGLINIILGSIFIYDKKFEDEEGFEEEGLNVIDDIR